MLHSSMVVLLMVLVGIFTVHGQTRCEKRVRRRGWGGTCFGTQYTLKNEGLTKCDALIVNTTASECSDEETCCVDCGYQTIACRRRFGMSFGRNECCPYELYVGIVRPESGCSCCKECKPRPYCRQNGGRCISPLDPKYNRAWCFEQKPNPRILKRACVGYNCWCCLWN